MSAQFTSKTFLYFDLAEKNEMNEKWFEKNKSLYEDHVKEPFSILVQQLDLRFGDKLPGIEFNPKKISRPLRPINKRVAGKSIIKTQGHITLWEKQSSMFEWNPAIYIQIGALKDDNVLGSGLYMVSSRQLKLMRRALITRYDEFHKILQNNKLKKAWGEMAGEKYVRFPKDFDETHKAAPYLKYKQFYLGQNLTRKEVTDKNFFKRVGEELELTLPFLNWVRNTVGTYEKKSFNFPDLD